MSKYWNETPDDDGLRTPEGFARVRGEVYVGKGEIVVVGDPPNCEEEESSHNCDEMGCTTFSHVLVRGPVAQPYAETRIEEPGERKPGELFQRWMTDPFLVSKRNQEVAEAVLNFLGEEPDGWPAG